MTSVEYAREVAQRSTCPTRQAGAVLVTACNTVITGYEGAARGQGHCDVVGCTPGLDPTYCARAIGAEVNTIIEAARTGVSTVGAVLYASAPLTPDAANILVNAGLRCVVAPEMAPSLHALLTDAGIEVISSPSAIRL